MKETFTGTKMDGRKEWHKLYKVIKQERKTGKQVVVVFDSVSRMSRNSEEGIALYEELFNLGIGMVFLKEPHINSDTYKKAIQNKV